MTLTGKTCHGNAKAKWFKAGTSQSVETRALEMGVLSKHRQNVVTFYSSPELTQVTQGDQIKYDLFCSPGVLLHPSKLTQNF